MLLPRGASWGVGLAATLGLVVLAVLDPATAAADEEVFTVADVPVDVTASDAELARATALAKGQRQALERLFRRLVPDAQVPRLPILTGDEITELVQGFQVDEERVAPRRYRALLSFIFKSDAIRSLLRASAVGFAETRSRPLLVLPVYQDRGNVFLWEDANAWRLAWANLPLPDGLVPVVVPIGDLADMGDIGAQAALAGDAERLAAIAERYGAGATVVAVGRLEIDPLTETLVLQVTLQRYGTEGVEISGGRYGAASEGVLGDLLVAAAQASRKQLEETWKEANLLRFDRQAALQIDIPLPGFEAWLDIRRRLAKPAQVRRVQVAALSPTFARVILHYLGDTGRLKTALAESELELTREGDVWIVRRSWSAGEGQADEPGGTDPGDSSVAE